MVYCSGLENPADVSVKTAETQHSCGSPVAHDAPFTDCSDASDGTKVGTDISIPRSLPVRDGIAFVGQKHTDRLMAFYDASGSLLFIYNSDTDEDYPVPPGDGPITNADLMWQMLLSTPPDRSDFVYFIGGDHGAIKIGRSVNVEVRLRTIQTHSPVPLRILATIEGGSRERLYHKIFAAHRLHGEWFAPHPDILAEIDRLKEAS